MNKDIKLYNGDCLVESDRIESGSVDLILTDLPYGNMKNAPSTWDKSKTSWDTVIEPLKIYDIANRILRKKGKLVLFSQEPYSTSLTKNTILNLPLSTKAIWEKDSFANSLGCNKNMVGFTEDILIFSKQEDVGRTHILRDYFLKVRKYITQSTNEINKALGNTMASHYFTKGNQFRFPSIKDYNLLVEFYNINTMVGFLEYKELEDINNKFSSTFNLWQGKKYKSNILKYKKDYNGFHPTQKPVLLLEDLIKTFSNENDLVVDLTMGSGSTGVACKNTNRSFTGIEMYKTYFDISVDRIKNTQQELFLGL